MPDNPTISVIIPVYNTEKYIERCLHSLFSQSLPDIEYIFINDASTDNSIRLLMNVLREYPDREKSVRIIHNEKNRGSSASRNTGLKTATADYVTFCDSDDWIEKDMYETLFKEVQTKHSDIVWCDLYIDSIQKRKYFSNILSPLTTDQAIRKLLTGEFPGHTCTKLIKKTLFWQVEFPEGYNMIEDLVVSVQLFTYAQTISHIPRALYHYVQNPASISNNAAYSEKRDIDIIHNINRIDAFFRKNNMAAYSKELDWLKLRYKSNIICRIPDKKSFFKNQWPEANRHIFKAGNIPFNLRLVMWGFANNTDLFLKIRHFILSLK